MMFSGALLHAWNLPETFLDMLPLWYDNSLFEKEGNDIKRESSGLITSVRSSIQMLPGGCHCSCNVSSA